MSDEPKALVLMPRTIDECASLAERFSKSALIPEKLRDKPADVFVTIAYGMEFGLGPMASLKGIHVVDGKPSLSADLMVGLVLASGKAKYFKRVAASNTSVTYETRRIGDDEPRQATWTMDDAKKAALNLKDNWRCYPRSMLAARAKAELARDVYPDLLSGCYTPDELGADDAIDVEFSEIKAAIPARSDAPAISSDVADAEFTDEPTSSPALADALKSIDDAPDLQALKAIAPSLAHVEDKFKPLVKAHYHERHAKLKQNGKPEAAAP